MLWVSYIKPAESAGFNPYYHGVKMNSISATVAGDLVYQSVTPGLFLYEKTCIVMLCMLRSTVGVRAHIDVHCQNMFLNEHSIFCCLAAGEGC